MANSAAKIVTDAILGKELKVVSVSGKVYEIPPPTIWKIAGAGNCLDNVDKAENLIDIIKGQRIMAAAEALSWFIQGDDSLKDELSHGSLEEVVNALVIAWQMVSVDPFYKLLGLAKSVSSLTAKQKL